MEMMKIFILVMAFFQFIDGAMKLEWLALERHPERPRLNLAWDVGVDFLVVWWAVALLS